MRFYHLGTESLWFDEASSVYSSSKSLYVMLGGSLQWQRQPPLYFFALKLWMTFFGDSETAIRSLSAIFGICSIPLIFLVGKILLSRRTGLIAAFLAAISYYFLAYSQEARDYAFLLFFTLLSYYCLIRIIKSANIRKRDYIFYASSTTLLVYSHYFGLFVVAAQIIYILIVRKQIKASAKYLRNALIAVAVFFAPWGIAFALISVPGSFSMGISTWSALLDTLKAYSGHSPSPWLMTLFTCACLLGLTGLWRTSILGFKPSGELARSWRKRMIDPEILLLVLWLLVPVVVPFLIGLIPLEITGIYRPAYTMGALPAFLLLASRGLDRLLNKKVLYPVCAGVLTGISVFSAFGLYSYYHEVQKEQWREAAGYIAPLLRENDVIVLNEAYFSVPFEYYYREGLKTQTLTPGEEAAQLQAFQASGKERIWFIQGPWGSTVTEDYLKAKRASLLEKDFVKIRVYLFR